MDKTVSLKVQKVIIHHYSTTLTAVFYTCSPTSFLNSQKSETNIEHKKMILNSCYKNKRPPESFFDVLLSVPLSITLVNDQLDAQFFYFIIRLLQSSTCFEQRRAHHQDVKLY